MIELSKIGLLDFVLKEWIICWFGQSDRKSNRLHNRQNTIQKEKKVFLTNDSLMHWIFANWRVILQSKVAIHGERTIDWYYKGNQ